MGQGHGHLSGYTMGALPPLTHKSSPYCPRLLVLPWLGSSESSVVLSDVILFYPPYKKEGYF